MPPPEVQPFAEHHLDDSGRLLAQRHGDHRRAQPLLSPRFEDAETATAAVAEVLALPDASGAVALRGGDVVGFLLGAPKDNPVWGPNLWVESAGMAVAHPEDARDLYAL